LQIFKNKICQISIFNHNSIIPKFLPKGKILYLIFILQSKLSVLFKFLSHSKNTFP
jgi:hypothetical protein